MFEITVILSCLITIVLLKIFLNINFSNLKQLQKRNSVELEKLSSKFPEDEQICKEILGSLGNKEVKIKIEPDYTSCLYTVFNNTITIGKFQQNYMKLQTIAHECIHSCQNKKTLWSNFIFTNIYLIYFAAILILELLNRLSYSNIHIIILIFLSFTQYILRNTLESDAMLRAKYVAKQYIEDNKILDKEQEKNLLTEYDEINNIGIPFINYYTLCMNIIKIIIFSFIVLI